MSAIPQTQPDEVVLSVTLPVKGWQQLLNILGEVALPHKVTNPLIQAIAAQAQQQINALQQPQTGEPATPTVADITQAVKRAARRR